MALTDYLLNVPYIGKRIIGRRERLEDDRVKAYQRLEDAISTTEGEIERLEAVPQLKPEEFYDEKKVESHLKQVFPLNGTAVNVFEGYKRFLELEDVVTPQLVESIVNDFKEGPLYSHRFRLTLMKMTKEHLAVSKRPNRDVDMLKQYFIASDEYARRVGDCGGCGFAAGPAPELPNYLRGKKIDVKRNSAHKNT